MKNVVILGSSPAGIKAAEEIRKSDSSAEITVFCEGNTPPFNRELLAGLIAGEVREEEVLYKTKEFYKEQNINVISGKKIQRIDFRKNRLITEEKEQIFFDTLIVDDVPMIRLPEIKGAQKMGVFHLRRLSDVKDLLSVLHLMDAVAIRADGILALKIAVALKKKKKEVIWILPSAQILPDLIDGESAGIIAKELEENGIRIIPENSIVEVLGEGDVKAIRLKTGKVLAVQAVVAGGAAPELKLFADTAVTLNSGIVVNDVFKTSLDNVFALDHVCQRGSQEFSSAENVSLKALEAQGQVAGKAICGETALYEDPLFEVSAQIFGLDFVLAGMTKSGIEAKEYLKADASAKWYRKIFVKDNRICGAILINCTEEKERILDFVKEGQDISVLGEGFLGEQAVQAVESEQSLTKVSTEAVTDGA